MSVLDKIKKKNLKKGEAVENEDFEKAAKYKKQITLL
jgi:protein-arginine kinase activator protein McsA